MNSIFKFASDLLNVFKSKKANEKTSSRDDIVVESEQELPTKIDLSQFEKKSTVIEPIHVKNISISKGTTGMVKLRDEYGTLLGSLSERWFASKFDVDINHLLRYKAEIMMVEDKEKEARKEAKKESKKIKQQNKKK